MHGLYEEIIGSDQDTEQIFNNGIPFFRELIYCFGPENIDDEKVDKYIDKIIKIMKDIFHAKLPIAIKAFISTPSKAASWSASPTAASSRFPCGVPTACRWPSFATTTSSS